MKNKVLAIIIIVFTIITVSSCGKTAANKIAQSNAQAEEEAAITEFCNEHIQIEGFSLKLDAPDSYVDKKGICAAFYTNGEEYPQEITVNLFGFSPEDVKVIGVRSEMWNPELIEGGNLRISILLTEGYGRDISIRAGDNTFYLYHE